MKVIYNGPLPDGEMQLASGQSIKFTKGIALDVPDTDAQALNPEDWQSVDE